MFEIGASEILLIAIVALIAIGPKDLPEILFRLGRMVRRVRMMMNGVRDQYSEIMHEAELNHYRKKFSSKMMDIDQDLEFRTDRPPQLLSDVEIETESAPKAPKAKEEKEAIKEVPEKEAIEKEDKNNDL